MFLWKHALNPERELSGLSNVRKSPAKLHIPNFIGKMKHAASQNHYTYHGTLVICMIQTLHKENKVI